MSELNVVKKLLADKIDEMYVLRQENAALKAEVASLRINQQPHGEICPECGGNGISNWNKCSHCGGAGKLSPC